MIRWSSAGHIVAAAEIAMQGRGHYATIGSAGICSAIERTGKRLGLMPMLSMEISSVKVASGGTY